MKIKNLLKMLDPGTSIVVYHSDDSETPIFDGVVFDFPFGYLNCDLDLSDEDFPEDYPIWLSQDLDGKKNQKPTHNHMAGLIISITG